MKNENILLVFCVSFVVIFFSCLIVKPYSIVQAYEVVPINNGGSITGIVRFEGAVPKPVVLPINKNPDVCGKESRVIQDVKVSGNILSNVVVYIDKIEKGKEFTVPKGGVKLTQDKCYFLPHLQVIKKRGKVSIISKDSIAHNIHTYEVGEYNVRTLFNQMQPDSSVRLTEKVKNRRSPFVKVECDIHSFMHAWIVSIDHPYFSMIKSDGMFKIEGIPPGKYKFIAWNPKLGKVEKELVVAADKELNTEFLFTDKKE